MFFTDETIGRGSGGVASRIFHAAKSPDAIDRQWAGQWVRGLVQFGFHGAALLIWQYFLFKIARGRVDILLPTGAALR